MLKQISTFIALLFVLHGPLIAAENNSSSWVTLAQEITRTLETVEAFHQQGNKDEAKKAVISAYFGLFEDQQLEAAMRIHIGAKYTYEVEQKFGAIRKAITQGVPQQDLLALTTALKTTLLTDAAKLDKENIPRNVFEVNR